MQQQNSQSSKEQELSRVCLCEALLGLFLDCFLLTEGQSVDSSPRRIKLVSGASLQSGFCRSFLDFVPSPSPELWAVPLWSDVAPPPPCAPLPPRFPFPHPVCQRERRKVGERQDGEGKDESLNANEFSSRKTRAKPKDSFGPCDCVISDLVVYKVLLKDNTSQILIIYVLQVYSNDSVGKGTR